MTNPIRNPSQKPSLQSFLNQRYISICIAIFMPFLLLIGYMNYWGMDDTSDYYMKYEAQVLSEHYSPYSEIIEFDEGFKEYYWGIDKLPAQYRQFAEQAQLNETTLYSRDDETLYILPYEIAAQPRIFYVIHRFKNDVFSARHQAIQYGIIAVCALLLLGLCGYIFRLNKSVVQPVEALYQWVGQLAQHDIVNQPPLAVPTSLQFDELEKTASALHLSLLLQHKLHAKQAQLIQREKGFLSSLSHELRTPIAIIAAALELLKVQGELSPTTDKVLSKLNRANNNMKQLTETLLHLWRRKPSSQPPQSIVLEEVINQAIADCTEQYNTKRELKIQATFISHPELQAQPEVTQIIINNLLRNACQYSEDGRITITTSDNGLMISNLCANPNLETESGDEAQQYGFGLGLYLVETLCQQLNWPFVVTASDQRFTVSVGFV